MQQTLIALKTKRQEVSEAKQQLGMLHFELSVSELGRTIAQAKAYLEAIQQEEKELDSQLRQLAIDNFNETGDKDPVNGVKVIINKSLEYVPDKAIVWCINNALGMLKLDKRAFEKHARAVVDTVPIEFIEIKEVPAVRIST